MLRFSKGHWSHSFYSFSTKLNEKYGNVGGGGYSVKIFCEMTNKKKISTEFYIVI